MCVLPASTTASLRLRLNPPPPTSPTLTNEGSRKESSSSQAKGRRRLLLPTRVSAACIFLFFLSSKIPPPPNTHAGEAKVAIIIGCEGEKRVCASQGGGGGAAIIIIAQHEADGHFRAVSHFEGKVGARKAVRPPRAGANRVSFIQGGTGRARKEERREGRSNYKA